ncbi:MAG TPA: hypothetical protein VFX16_07230, partial [Pseudonocardiaceae bacterium]|nr:hypothetical protein [Pseudonocardiaceae bacterium]
MTAHVHRLERRWNRVAALDDTVLATAQQLQSLVGGEVEDLETWHLLGRYYLHRVIAFREHGEDSPADREAMTAAFSRCLGAGPAVPSRTTGSTAADTAVAMFKRALESSDVAACTAVASLWQRTIQSVPVGHPARPVYLFRLSATLAQRYRWLNDPADLDATITLGKQAIEATTAGDGDLPDMLSHVASAQVIRYQRSGNHADLDAAIETFEQALRVHPTGSGDCAACMMYLGQAYRLRFENKGDADDLESAVSLSVRAVAAATGGEALPDTLQAAGAALFARFGRTGAMQDLESAVQQYRQALDALRESDPRRPVCLCDLGNTLAARFGQTSAMSDLHEAIVLCRQALAAVPEGHPTRAWYLSNLGQVLITDANIRNDLAGTDEAIACLREAIATNATAPHQHGMQLLNLTYALQTRFRLTDALPDLDEALTLLRDAVHDTPDDDSMLPLYLQNLAAAKGARFARTDQLADLEESIAASDRVLSLVAPGHPRLPMILAYAASTLLDRHSVTKKPDDLDRTIVMCRRAMALTIAGQSDELSIQAVLGTALEAQFERTGDEAILAEAIAVYREAAEFNHGPSLLGLGRMLLAKGRRAGPAATAELDDAVATLRAALTVAPPGVERAMYQDDLSRALRLRFEWAGDEADLDEALMLSRAAVDATPFGHANLVSYRLNLADTLRARPPEPPRSADPNRAEQVAAVTVLVERLSPSDMSTALDPDAVNEVRRLTALLDGDNEPDLHAWEDVGMFEWCRCLALPGQPAEPQNEALAAAIHAYTPSFLAGRPVPDVLRKFVAEDIASEMIDGSLLQAVRTLDAETLTPIVDLWRRIVAAAGDDHPDLALYLALTGGTLCARHAGTGDPTDLDEAITLLRKATSTADPTNPRVFIVIDAFLSDALLREFLRTGDLDVLDQAIDAGRRTVDATAGEVEQQLARVQLGTALTNRTRLTDSADDLDAGIAVLTEAVKAMPDDDWGRGIALAQLAESLLLRHTRTGVLADLELAAGSAAEAVTATEDDQPHFVTAANHLGLTILLRAQRARTWSDVDAAIGLFERGAAADRSGRIGRWLCLGNLGLARLWKFHYTGNPAELDAAVDADWRAVNETPPGHFSASGLMSRLSIALLARFELAGRQVDLDAGLEAARAAVDAAPTGHPDTAAFLSGLAQALRMRHARTNDMDDLDEAFSTASQAVASTADGHPDRPIHRMTLSAILTAKFLEVEDSGLLDDAVEAATFAVEELSDDDPREALCLQQLGTALQLRSSIVDGDADLDKALAAMERASVLTDGPEQAKILISLGLGYEAKFDQTGEDEDADAAITLYTLAAQHDSAAPGVRIAAAEAGAQFAAELAPAHAAELLADAVRLLPLTTPRQLTRSDQQHVLSQYAFLASDAAALTLEAGGPDAAARALGLLELGRAVLQGQALDIRSDLIELHVSHP